MISGSRGAVDYGAVMEDKFATRASNLIVFEEVILEAGFELVLGSVTDYRADAVSFFVGGDYRAIMEYAGQDTSERLRYPTEPYDVDWMLGLLYLVLIDRFPDVLFPGRRDARLLAFFRNGYLLEPVVWNDFDETTGINDKINYRLEE